MKGQKTTLLARRSNPYLESLIKVIKMDNYKKSLQNDKKIAAEFYKKSLIKTQQQIFLENLLLKNNKFANAKQLGDFACGGGTLSFHLSKINTKATYHLIDYNEDAVQIAKNILNGDNFNISTGNIYNLEFKNNKFDMTFCWMSFLMLKYAEKALHEMIRVTKQGGIIYISSLFNLDHDIDIYNKFLDHTRPSARELNFMNYNTYSKFTIEKWLNGKVDNFIIHKFETPIPFEYNDRGIGTYTKKCEDGYLQISGGMLMNWGILEITK